MFIELNTVGSWLLWLLAFYGRWFGIGFGWSVFAIDELLCYFAEEKVDVIAIFGRYFDIRISILLGILFDLFFSDLPLTNVGLVSDQEDHRILSSRLPHEIQPFINSLQGWTQTHINHYQTSIGISYIARDERSEALLTSSIPELQSQGFALNLHSFGDEIDSYGGLSE